jgi:hypothetical protein
VATIKETSTSNAPVLGLDATSATSRQILGVPLYVSQYVAANTLWAIDSSRVFLVVREDATVEADSYGAARNSAFRSKCARARTTDSMPARLRRRVDLEGASPRRSIRRGKRPLAPACAERNRSGWL